MSSAGCAIVTGGSRGIGRAVCVQLARDGFDVAFCSRSENEHVAETARLIEEAGARSYYAACDVASYEDVRAFVKAAEAALGPVSALVNSAGITQDSPMVMMKPESWTEVLETNLTGTFNFCHSSVLGFMKRRRGAVVNISSVSGVYGIPGQSNYSASKAGIIGMSKAMAKELGSYGVRVNVVAPGFTETDMVAHVSKERLATVTESSALRRAGKPEEVADAVSFLLSDRATYITGHVLHVDGGASL